MTPHGVRRLQCSQHVDLIVVIKSAAMFSERAHTMSELVAFYDAGVVTFMRNDRSVINLAQILQNVAGTP